MFFGEGLKRIRMFFTREKEVTKQRVIHRDIKSANILLDENLNAKDSDFGLSKISPANQKITFLVTSSVGTPGYCDPLYMDDYQLTKESDVYSFGVVLFEVLCGRVCFENSNGNFKVFVNDWKRCYEQNKLDEIIFSDLSHQMDPSSVRTFVDIAYQCLQKSHEQRPTMSTVVKKLKAALVIDFVVVIDACADSAEELLRSNHGREVLFENEAIASVVATPKSEEEEEEHLLENIHSSRTIRKLIIESPSFASTLWEKAFKGKCKTWARGHSAKVVCAYLETTDPKVLKLAKKELQPLLKEGVLELPENNQPKKSG
ncbi:protein kinase, ATP binding site, Serine/threonine-protein kinase Plk3 [Artemisia annua]|uniref:Protein kinase, ATP binding site, Serine/threonine-protein kinase Plk3 n=1 Tax=Artemisia annua TaxID=35608 RepID=A0A2U1QCI8_ARTAN|nr:protein kinase, ATP binding site, Serine/threonine-protein kinase Plk3 [Artemisia annua]